MAMLSRLLWHYNGGLVWTPSGNCISSTPGTRIREADSGVTKPGLDLYRIELAGDHPSVHQQGVHCEKRDFVLSSVIYPVILRIVAKHMSEIQKCGWKTHTSSVDS